MPAPKPQSQFTPQPKSTRFFCSTPSLFGVSYTLILSPPSHFVFPILFYVLVHSLYHVIAFTTIFIVFFALFFISLDIGNTWLINFNYYKIICMNYFDEIYFHSHSLQHNCVTTLAHFCDWRVILPMLQLILLIVFLFLPAPLSVLFCTRKPFADSSQYLHSTYSVLPLK